MNRFLFTGIEAFAASFAVIPVILYLKKLYGWSIRKTVFYTALSLYLAGMYAVVGLPNVAYIRFDPNFNFEPFAYMFSDLDSTLLNVMLFIPFGLLLPLLWQDFKAFWKTLLLGFGFSLLIETLQIFTYRATDVNDLMTNTVGTLIGWITARLMLKVVPGLIPEKNSREFPLLLGVTFGIMFFLHPFLSGLVWSILR